ncbi:MAG: hypothetical protein OEO79_14425 [Gemmatimonadota bacterium]|nr:hypothetical protein [Gemmatimonadota bacterium]
MFVVALGILLAFVVDAAWAELQETEQERLTLEALREEFTANVTSLRGTAALHDAVVQASDQLLAHTGPAASDTTGVSRLIGEVWVPTHSEVASGAIQSLLSTNDLARIRDAELRRALAAWPEMVAALVRIEDALHMIQRDRLMASMQRTVPLIEIELVNGFARYPELREAFTAAVEPSRFGNDLIPLIRDLQFENAVLHRMTVSMIASARTIDLAEEGERILGLVERGLR